MNTSDLSRRAALTALAGASAPLLAACMGVDEPRAGTSTGGSSTTPVPTPSANRQPTPTAAPTLTRPPTPKFTSDYVIPPIENGMVPVITRVITRQPVVFLTIDDGAVKDPANIALLDKLGYPATLFLTKSAMGENPAYFKKFQARGDRIQNHTIHHNTQMVQQGYDYELAEISGMQEYIQQNYGKRPTLFRPPGGAYSNAMRTACAQAGIKAIIHWECKANAGHMDYQYGNALRPGDICLMHFRPEFEADLMAFHKAKEAAGLTVVRLDDFIRA